MLQQHSNSSKASTDIEIAKQSPQVRSNCCVLNTNRNNAESILDVPSWPLSDIRVAFHKKSDEEIRRARLNYPIYFNADEEQPLSKFLKNPELTTNQKVNQLDFKCVDTRKMPKFVFSQMIMLNPVDDECFEILDDNFWNPIGNNFFELPQIPGFELRKSNELKNECIIIGCDTTNIKSCRQFIQRLRSDYELCNKDLSKYFSQFKTQLAKGMPDYFILSSTSKFDKEKSQSNELIRLLMSLSDDAVTRLLKFKAMESSNAVYEISKADCKDKAWIMGSNVDSAIENLRSNISEFSPDSNTKLPIYDDLYEWFVDDDDSSLTADVLLPSYSSLSTITTPSTPPPTPSTRGGSKSSSKKDSRSTDEVTNSTPLPTMGTLPSSCLGQNSLTRSVPTCSTFGPVPSRRYTGKKNF